MTSVRFLAGVVKGSFLFATAFRTVLEPIQPPIQWVILGTLTQGIRRPGREVDHSPPSSEKVNNTRSYTSSSLILLRSVVLKQ